MIFKTRMLRLLTVSLLLSGCATTGGRGPVPETTVVVEPPSPAPAVAVDDLPPLPVAIVEDPHGAGRRIEQIELVDQDLRLVLRSLAESFGLNYRLDPTITGTVTTRLQDVTLEQALDAIVLPYGYSYGVEGNVLRVMPAQMVTRIFPLDYVSMSRSGIGSTIVQRRLGSSTAGGIEIGGGGAVGGSGADVIESVTIADFWNDIRISLEGLLFTGNAPVITNTPDLPTRADSQAAAPSTAAANIAAGAAPNSGATAAGTGGVSGLTRAPGAVSLADAAGRRLLINPIAGTILVTATPTQLEEVAAFIAAIEGSVHRQVLIEARIVEVALSRDFEFGIDWSALQRLGGLAFELGLTAAGSELRLSTGGDTDREIGAVLRALESQGNVNVLSAPRVSVLNNQRAIINVATDEIFFSVQQTPIFGADGVTIGVNQQIVPQQIAVGIVLDVLAQIAADNTITMNVRPAITDVVEVRELVLEDGTQASAPVIDRRETDTVVRVRDGETIVIGGLMRTALVSNRTGVPGLSRLPWVGRFFGGQRESTDKRELVIFITPSIIAGQPALAR